VLRNRAGKLELLTAPLDDKIILDGVTRRSVLELSKARFGGELDVVERKFTMHDLVEAFEEGRLVEAFAAGTAYFVAPITNISFRDKEIVLPLGGKESCTMRVKEWLVEIMYGKVEHEWGVVVEETGFKAESVDEREVGEMVRKIKELKASKAWEAALEKVKAEELGE